VIPLDEIEKHLSSTKVDLAVNIHSFSECQVAAVNWWIGLLRKHEVPFLFIVPNTGEKLATCDGQDISNVPRTHGYKMIAREPKYRDPLVQEYAINPAWHYLFEFSERGL
jgi:hypothetical protein